MADEWSKMQRELRGSLWQLVAIVALVVLVYMAGYVANAVKIARQEQACEARQSWHCPNGVPDGKVG
jgi:hypothetical protein